MTSQTKPSTVLPIHHFEQQQDWTTWLIKSHNTSSGVWLKLAKKGANTQSVSYDEAVEIALCRSEEHTSELQSLMRISYAVFCLKHKNKNHKYNTLNQDNNK